VRTTAGIAFDDVGDGDTALLLLSGWGGPRTVYWPLLTRLAPHVRAIAMDYRGHGGSAPVTGDFGYAELLADAKSVIDAAGVSRVIPVGLSHGGWAALDLRRSLGAARVPAIGLIDWMVLGAPPPFFDALAGLQTDQWAAVRERLFTMWTTGVTAPAVHAYIEEMRRADGPMWQRAAREIAKRFAAEPQPLAVIERDPCPTVHIYAQPADPGYLAAQQDYATGHPWFAAHRVAASSHFPMLEAPDQVATHLIELSVRAK
jgi:pimeloyl-ACP methyl ester carboxylesterase